MSATLQSEKPTVYIETTIPSFLTARPSGDLIVAGRQLITRQWWEQRRSEYRLFISQYVLDEAMAGDADAAQKRKEALRDLQLLPVDEETLRLARVIVAAGAIPARAATDAGHIALAARHGLDFLMTWNCAHIANAEIIRKISALVRQAGYELPVICTPDELFGEDSNEG
jgi:predicted nucleic acid-binding protein